MEQTKLLTYLEEVSNWVKEIKQMEMGKSEDLFFENTIEEDIQSLLIRIDELRNDRTISTKRITDTQKLVESISTQAQIILTSAENRKIPNQRVPIGGHVLPPLPYPYNALEPHISEEIMRLHHDTHHKSYVEGLNKAEKMMEQARLTNNYELLKHWEREAAFHGSGHYLHTIFWYVMKRNGGGEPTGNLLGQINKDFGSFKQFKVHFTEAANKVEGVGWAILVWSPRSHRLEILQTEKHQLMTQWDTIPLLVLDVWEHAYYLQYKANRGEYIQKWWNVVNWDEVEKRFTEASKLKWKSF